VNKAELSEKLAKKTGFTMKDARAAVDALFSVDDGIIVSAMKQKKKVQITGFGTFQSQKRSARTVRIPGTEGKTKRVAAHRYPRFKPGKTLKDKMR
jgi:DNA-binding protein HU-beta